MRRTGRITPAQGRALDELWPLFGIEYSADLLNLDEIFEAYVIGRTDGQVGPKPAVERVA